MPFTHVKTVTVSPADDLYSWSVIDDATNNTATWITVTEDSNIEDQWDFLVQDNTGSARSATATVNHSNGVTTDSFTIDQAGAASTTSSSTTSSTTAAPQSYSIQLGITEQNPGQLLINNANYVSGTVQNGVWGAGGVSFNATAGTVVTWTMAMSCQTGYDFTSVGGNDVASLVNEVNGLSITSEVNTAHPSWPNMITVTFSYTVPASNVNLTQTVSVTQITESTTQTIALYGPLGPTYSCTETSPYITASYDDATGTLSNPEPSVSVSLAGVSSNGQASYLVVAGSGGSATTGSAVQLIGQTLGIMEEEIMGINSCSPVTTTTTTTTSGGGGCHLPGTLIELTDGTYKPIEAIAAGDQVKTASISGLSLEEEAWMTWSTPLNSFSMTESTGNVTAMHIGYMDGYRDINNGLIRLTHEHPLLSDQSGVIAYRQAKDLGVGDKIYRKDIQGNLSWIEIMSYERVLLDPGTAIHVYSIDVENEDSYFANGVIAHNIQTGGGGGGKGLENQL